MWIHGLESSTVGASETQKIPEINPPPFSSELDPFQFLDVQSMTPFFQGDNTVFSIGSETLSIFASR